MRIATKIFHPNIDSEKGDIDLDILAEKWKPEMTILSVLSALVGLLIKPEIFYLQDASAAAIMYKTDYFEYHRKAS